MKNVSIRAWYFVGFAVCVLALTAVLFMEHVQGLEPCPTCQVQRIVVGLIAATFLVAVFFTNKGAAKLYGVIITCLSAFGMLFAGRQIYLQLAHSSHYECIPSMADAFDKMPFLEALKTLYLHSGACSQISFEFLKLNLAEWGFFTFFVLAILALVQIPKVHNED